MARSFVSASTQFLRRTTPVPATARPLTVSIWAKPTSQTGASNRVASMLSGTGGAAPQIHLLITTTGAAQAGEWDGTTAVTATTSALVNGGAWNPICGGHNGVSS